VRRKLIVKKKRRKGEGPPTRKKTGLLSRTDKGVSGGGRGRRSGTACCSPNGKIPGEKKKRNVHDTKRKNGDSVPQEAQNWFYVKNGKKRVTNLYRARVKEKKKRTKMREEDERKEASPACPADRHFSRKPGNQNKKKKHRKIGEKKEKKNQTGKARQKGCLGGGQSG